MQGTLGPATWANVYYFSVDAGAATPGEVLAALTSVLHDLYDVAFDYSLFPPEWSTTHQTLTYRDAEDSIVRITVADANVGTSTGNTQDAQVAYLVNWANADPRRGGKPRQYLAGVPDDNMLDSARLDTAMLGPFSSRLNTWLEEIVTRDIPFQLIELSFSNGGVFRTSPISYPIIGATLNPVVATQRRRVNRLRPS
jgi:hypothetical protein